MRSSVSVPTLAFALPLFTYVSALASSVAVCARHGVLYPTTRTAAPTTLHQRSAFKIPSSMRSLASNRHALAVETPHAESAEHLVAGELHLPQHLDRNPLARAHPLGCIRAPVQPGKVAPDR